jgi:hypothetical protein
MEAKIYIPDEAVYATDFYTDSFDFTEVYYNALEPADNSCRITIPFNEELSDKLKISGDKDIKIEVKKDDGANLITGFLRKSYAFEKTQRHQGIALEIVSPSHLLKINLTDGFYLMNNTVAQIANRLLNEAGFPSSSIALNAVVNIFTVEAGEEIYSVLKQLLFEHEHAFDFDANGNFILCPLFNKPAGDITQHFNGHNIREKLTQEITEKTYEDITTNWSSSEYYTNVLLYENTEGRNAAHPDGCQIEVYPNSYLFGNEWNLLDYDSALGTVVWADSVSVNDEYNTDIKADWPLSVTRPVENRGKSARLQIRNNSSSAAAFVERLRIRGNAYIEIPGQRNRVPGKGKSLSIDLKYNHNPSLIDALTRNIAEYYRYARFTVSLKSDEDYPLGSFAVVTEEAMGTVKGRIVAKKHKWREPIEYAIEAMEAYNPVEDMEVLRKSSSKMNNVLAVPPDITPPSDPTITNILQNGDGSISVAFNPSTDDESGVNYYNVYRSESGAETGTRETPAVVLSLGHTGSAITFTDHATNNNVWYFYQITAVDRANNESGKSNELHAKSLVTDPPQSPFILRAVAGTDGIAISILLNDDTSAFENNISAHAFFRLQISKNNGASYSDLGKFQGSYYLWKYDIGSITSSYLKSLRFRAYSFNIFNVETPAPIMLENNKVSFSSKMGPPFTPDESDFTVKMTVPANGAMSLPKGWYLVKAVGGGGGAGGGGGGGGGGVGGLNSSGSSTLNDPRPGYDGKSGQDGKDGGTSGISLNTSGINIFAYGGAGGKGGQGGEKGEKYGGDGGGKGSQGQDGQKSGKAEKIFYLSTTETAVLFTGLGGAGGNGGEGGKAPFGTGGAGGAGGGPENDGEQGKPGKKN